MIDDEIHAFLQKQVHTHDYYKILMWYQDCSSPSHVCDTQTHTNNLCVSLKSATVSQKLAKTGKNKKF